MSRWIGRGIVVAALAAAAFVVATMVVPGLGRISGGAAGIRDALTLPERIDICGRTWRRDALDRRLGLAEIRATDGVEPVVVDPRPFAPCPAGPCTTVAQNGPCNTVIYVRVGEDAYVGYALQGGP